MASLFPYWLIAPIGLLLLAVTFYPLVYAVWLSLTNAKLLTIAKAHFIGLSNFLALLHDTTFIDSLWRTLRWDVSVVGLELLIALPVALFLNLEFRGRGFVRAAVIIPYIVPQAVTGLMWVYMFDGNFGVFNDILLRLGIIGEFVSWMSDPNGSFAIVVAAMTWSGMPLITIILLAALQTIPKDLYEAAGIDGATVWQKFCHITIPHLVPTILFIMLLRVIWMSNSIDMIFVMTGGGPGFANYTTAVYSFIQTGRLDIGYSSAIAVCLALILMFISIFYVRHLVKQVLE
ncbi:MAG TPA: sugar ABC transporter permease [Devosiaceae bacterium]|jgi:multiple sugar transport system permease protein